MDYIRKEQLSKINLGSTKVNSRYEQKEEKDNSMVGEVGSENMKPNSVAMMYLSRVKSTR